MQLRNRFFKLVLVCFINYFIYSCQHFQISHHLGAIIILEHSFYLSQQNDPQPVSSAAQKYLASNTPASVGQALEDFFKHNKASDGEKTDMVFNIIIQNRMGELNICFNIFFH